MDILLGVAREAVNESEVTFLYTTCADFEVFLWLIWNVVFRIFCRIVVLVCIDTEKAEVSGVTWPHPVISFAAELTD